MKNKEHNKILETYQKNLEKARTVGIAIGVQTVCKVIYDKAMNKDKSKEERLDDIINFCKVPIK